MKTILSPQTRQRYVKGVDSLENDACVWHLLLSVISIVDMDHVVA